MSLFLFHKTVFVYCEFMNSEQQIMVSMYL